MLNHGIHRDGLPILSEETYKLGRAFIEEKKYMADLLSQRRHKFFGSAFSLELVTFHSQFQNVKLTSLETFLLNTSAIIAAK